MDPVTAIVLIVMYSIIVALGSRVIYSIIKQRKEFDKSALDQMKSKGLEAPVPDDTHYMKVNKFDYRLHWDRWVKYADLTALYDMQDAMHAVDAPPTPLEEMCQQNVELKKAVTEEQQRASTWYAAYKRSEKKLYDLESATRAVATPAPKNIYTIDNAFITCASCGGTVLEARKLGYPDWQWSYNQAKYEKTQIRFLLCPVCTKSLFALSMSMMVGY